MFDRMLATNEQIKLAEQARSMLPLFASPEQGHMTPEEFDGFSMNLYKSRDWLKGKGGYFMQGRLCVEIQAPGRPLLYVDPSGSDYCRYIARLG